MTFKMSYFRTIGLQLLKCNKNFEISKFSKIWGSPPTGSHLKYVNQNINYKMVRCLTTSTCCNRKRGPVDRQPKAKWKSVYDSSGITTKPKLGDRSKVVEAWIDITVRQLAKQMKKDTGTVFKAMNQIESCRIYKSPDDEIVDAKQLKEILFINNMKLTLVQHPERIKEKVIVNKDAFPRDPPDPSELVNRPAVLTIMGHVDHGKTTLLDTLRHSHVVDTEFGGITQHIGAFTVRLPSGEKVTVLDTPGHAAFSAMRARGAHVTDLVVLVVAADDGVMPQTRECIELANEAKVPMVVAINKVDKSNADVARTRRLLLQEGVQLEEDGGDILSAQISALKGTNLPLLIETIVAQAELLELKGDPTGLPEGHVIEARLDHGKGKIATVVVTRGTLRKGDYVVAGQGWAKVRGIVDDSGKALKEASLAQAVQVLGWRELPSAGDEVLGVTSEKRVHEVMTWRKHEERLSHVEEEERIVQEKLDKHLETYRVRLAERRKSGYRSYRREFVKKEKEQVDTGKRLSVVLKCDVAGSLETIIDVLRTYESEEVPLDILGFSVGEVTPSDVELAHTFGGFIYTFNLSTAMKVKNMANASNVPIKEHNIIYRLIDDIKEEISELLTPLEVEHVFGEADVLEEFQIGKGKVKSIVAGCSCVQGHLLKDKLFKLIRNEEVLFNGPLLSMKHMKDEVKDVKKGTECGLMLQDKSIRIQPNDSIVCYEIQHEKRPVDWHPPGF